ncbi:MAG: 4Fe-4S dicluster domain-containing protein [Wenzhouxiangella sp.]|nr:MAG: 4Fe-4S dicluster domain-containing protein [Wenzhouxiangella sp.]
MKRPWPRTRSPLPARPSRPRQRRPARRIRRRRPTTPIPMNPLLPTPTSTAPRTNPSMSDNAKLEVQALDLAALGRASATGQARAAALAEYEEPPGASEWVEYRSEGRLLIIGPADEAWGIAEQLKGDLKITMLATSPPSEPPDRAPPGRYLDGRPRELSGYLGAFTLKVEVDRGRVLEAGAAFGIDPGTFDLVLDLDGSADSGVDEPPVGYYRIRSEADRERALAELPEMKGEFQKPRFFAYDPDICAHGSRGLSGCRKCVDACATGAAYSIGEKIEIDPYLCQGCGSCVTVCPSGAMRYTAPSSEDLLDSIRRLLTDFRDQAGEKAQTPDVLLYSADSALATLVAVAGELPEHVLPIAVEDVGSVGADTWLSLLAYGAGRVVLLTGPSPAPTLLDATRRQIDIYRVILEGLGDPHAGDRLVLQPGKLDLAGLAEPLPAVVEQPATHGAIGTKREIIRLALAHLHDHAPGQVAETIALPATAPFGEIKVDKNACTLCMACVSVCPVSAIQGGGDLPQLHFREDQCVQCGICETACPEDAISLRARLHFPAHLQPGQRLLNEEEMHHCDGCGKPFATRKMMESMTRRLKDHWMFQGEEALARIRLCEDCRIQRMYEDEGGVVTHPPERRN